MNSEGRRYELILVEEEYDGMFVSQCPSHRCNEVFEAYEEEVVRLAAHIHYENNHHK